MSDVSKQVWKFQEGLVKLALLHSNVSEEQIYWDQRPELMSIEPDIVVGETLDSPDYVIFVTHAAAESASQKKFWRTFAEVVEIKTLLGPKVKVFSVLFVGSVKENLKRLYVALFDRVLHLGDKSYGSSVTNECRKMATKMPGASTDQSLGLIRQRLDSSSDFRQCFQLFQKDIADLTKAPLGELQRVWRMMHNTSEKITVDEIHARRTFLRSGMAQLAILPTRFRKKVYTCLEHKQDIKDVPLQAKVLNLFSAQLGRYVPSDEIRDIISLVGSRAIERIVNRVENEYEIFANYLQMLRSLPSQVCYLDFIIHIFSHLTQPPVFLDYLRKVFDDPEGTLISGLPTAPVGYISNQHWLFESIMILLKASSGRMHGYGYSSLERDINAVRSRKTQRFRRLDRPFTWLVTRKEYPTSELTTLLAQVFTTKLAHLGVNWLKENKDTFLKYLAKVVMTQKIMQYWHFTPINYLVLLTLDENGIKYRTDYRLDSFLSSVTGINAGTTENVIAIGEPYQAIIKCQSAFEGRIDKRKELCGRVASHKYKYNTAKKTFEPSDWNAFFLVVDGYFENEDLRLLKKAGWDAIFYPDEMNELIERIQSLK